jgi:Fic family protein
MNKPLIGHQQKQPEGFNAFVPGPFPPNGIVLSNTVSRKHAEAMRLMGKLDGYAGLLPDKDFFLLMFLRKDAASSSQIEGTQATMMDAIEAESKDRPSDIPPDVDDILHYIKAVDYGFERIKNFPLSLRLIRELHKELMVGARSTQSSYPGEFRSSQNWIGGTAPSNARFVPPPVHEMKRALNELEKFMRTNDDHLPLIKAGLLHAQFETIHPFSDGNGRTGRILVTIYLWHTKLLDTPVLYLSSYFKQHQDIYYEKLDGYHGEPSRLDEWLNFFLDGVIEIANASIATCVKITELRERDMRKAQGLGKTSANSTIALLKQLFKQPIVSAADVRGWAGYSSRQAAYNAIERLTKLEILKPLKSPDTYGQRYVYEDYIKIFQD